MASGENRSKGRRHVVVSTVKSSGLVKDRQHRIVQASIDVFLEKGFHSATISDVATKVGLSQGTLYNYVRSKEEILYLICVEAIVAYQSAVHSALAHADTPSKRLVSVVRATVEMMLEYHKSTLVVYREAHILQGDLIKTVIGEAREFIQQVERVVEESVNAGVIPPCNQQLAANIITYLPTMVANRAWNMPYGLSREDLIDSVINFVLSGLGLTARGGCSEETPSDS